MDRASYFITDRALFGSYPTQDAVIELEDKGVRYFVDLTHSQESKITPYKSKYSYISFPIADRQIPHNTIEFSCFIIKLSEIINSLKDNTLLYIHCKGGHGRSGIVVSILLSYMFGLSPQESLDCTSRYHSSRKEMRDKWRKIGSPQTFQQKNFVTHFCKELSFSRSCRNTLLNGLSSISNHPIYIPDIGTFINSEAAIHAHKNIENKNYVKKLLDNWDNNTKYFSANITPSKDWLLNSDQIIFNILKIKFDSNNEIKSNLLNTKLCKLIYYSKYDSFLGNAGDGSGSNVLGIQLMKLREHYYKEIIK